MLNIYDHSLLIQKKKLSCDGLLFVEYTCIPDIRVIDDLWSPMGHLVFVTSGQKTWITPEGEFHLSAGEALYCRKGACIMRNYYEDDFCALLFFFPKEFIRDVLLEFDLNSVVEVSDQQSDKHLFPVVVNLQLKQYFESVSTYFFAGETPVPGLIKTKFKELLLQLLTQQQSPELRSYLKSTLSEVPENLELTIRRNLFFHLSLEDYARLCNRSLSAFKRDFKFHFGKPPMQWIMGERLEYARTRLKASDEPVSEVAFYSGFESVSHFIRSFKLRFGCTPLQFRKQYFSTSAE